ncbi:response regulator transcription factor [Bacillus salipaludis]|uniref:Response regulator transcription factor n=1 Tax=Bacillus salipaludis TaxID=2547811 RepID=A0A4R5VRN2_9BACI|nr:response regulator transcription factor [Bacillus salipaludis]MDQ6598378.1 response regulator transcription factor [Bacillus salipaludis]MED1467456.1 response regulator transcription factor [Bacillus salipaludis]TDK61059.1 response regulator transcription factor [Bacillus salipaludis]
MKKRILVIEDEVNIAKVLKIELEYESYEVFVEHDGKSGLNMATEKPIDLILLDVMLPEMNGIEVLRRLRKAGNQTPVILLTARNMTLDKVTGLDQGANDYITKPFEIEELLARVRACIRDHSIHSPTEDTSVLTVGDLSIDTNTREVSRDGNSITVTPKEYDLLLYLVTNKNKVVTRDNIILNVWGYEYEGETNVIDVFIRHLRKKVDEGFDSELIHTVRGVGFTVKEK